jgi:ABC-type transporter Mla subunit MlaD
LPTTARIEQANTALMRAREKVKAHVRSRIDQLLQHLPTLWQQAEQKRPNALRKLSEALDNLVSFAKKLEQRFFDVANRIIADVAQSLGYSFKMEEKAA